ncbi:tripartite tricarboxylate transporter TctB family protein [Salinicoccus halitifaciens]|uniref:Tricarboxylic transport membrane protein n=1 Tax=Salinicoccus halitifaciens TaxID=1073415 RepID=A0ABV2E8L6_9STAP|nr:tripartite tricarboxylate transporter TctB family protein [Salinicoccus halitifaciens]MCD2137883.1 tripartite tricarboxylate transporter TctB family protein [Salinicoccus halitifaciens]
MDVIRYIMPIFLILIASVYLILTFNLPEANIGNPTAAMNYPLLIGFSLLILSILYLLNEYKLSRKEKFDNYNVFKDKELTVKFLIVLGLCIVYSLIFEQVGFLISTSLFLLALLFVVNGRKQWLINIIVAITFSFATWYSFSELLGVSLP